LIPASCVTFYTRKPIKSKLDVTLNIHFLQDLNDFLSDSEPDVSQYQAEVCASFQTVALVNTQPQPTSAMSRLQQSSSSPKFLNLDRPRRKISLSENLKAGQDDDASSPEELSYRADDFPDDDDDDDFLKMNLPSDNKPVNGNLCVNSRKLVLNFPFTERIPEYTAVEEARNVRNHSIITLPDGKMREIDMKVSH